MAVYFDHRVETPENCKEPSQLKWHPVLSLLAVASRNSTTGGNVNIYLQQGENVENCRVERAHRATVLCWHPIKPVLALGWENGEVLLLSHSSGDQNALPSTHTVHVTLLEWSSSGSRLVTGDRSGALAVWKVDARGRLQGYYLVKHTYNSPITYCIFKPASPGDDVNMLARASVSGDENALDMFSWKGAPLKMGPQEGLAFYVSTADGKVHSVDEHGKTDMLLSMDGAIKKMFYAETKALLTVITETMMLSQYTVGPEGEAQEFQKVKLSSRSGQGVDVVWAQNSLVVTATGEQQIRLWDLERNENYTLSLDETSGFERGEMVNCVSYCLGKEMLAAGTSHGRIAMWKMALHAESSRIDTKAQWKLQTPTEIEGNVIQLQWGSSLNLLAANNSNTVVILHEHVMSAHCSQQVAAVQLTPTQLSITQFHTGLHLALQSEMHIKGVCVTKDSATVWSGKQVTVFEMTGAALHNKGSFPCDSHVVDVHGENLYMVEPNRVQIRTPQGTVKQLLTFSKSEGNPILLSVCQSYLVVGTDTSHIRVYDLARRDAKAHCNAKNLADQIPNLGALRSVKCNANGSQVSILITQVNGRPDQKVYFYDIEMDTVTHFDFFTGRPSSGITQPEDSERQQFQLSELSGRCPVSHFWDESEPRLFVCETVPISSETSSAGYWDTVDVSVVTLFCTQEHGLLLQDCYPKPAGLQALLALDVPYYYFSCKLLFRRGGVVQSEEVSATSAPANQSQPSRGSVALFPQMVSRRALRDFEGLENCDKSTRDAMLNFSFYLTVGHMDEAFKSIKLIKSKVVWENMARMCVKTRRLDVARVCLGNMGNARAAKALKEAEAEPEPEAHIAALAIQLGMLEDAEKLYKSCQRYDLLNNLYQAAGQCEKALEIAENHDRIHLRTTYYNYARYLESMGDKSLALANYEKSETHRVDVPRMLQDDPMSLEIYVNRMKDKNLYKWWAQYLESQSDMDSALDCYESAQDYLSLVRVYCYMGNIQKACEIAIDTGDRAASYHLARHYESHDDTKQAVHFYTRAQAYNNAIRLCKENGLDDQLMNLALLSNPEDMMEAACYYEEKGVHMDRAVSLYHKAGYVSKALEVAFATEQFAALQMVAEDLNESSDPALLARCSEFFIQHSQYKRAVELLIAAKKYPQALELCVNENLTITEEFAEKMTATDSKDLSEESHKELLEKIAECCVRQGNYHLASKKFTQAGNKHKAMRALLKSGDTERIILFANVCRQRELFIMAANYLQSVDWKNPEIVKTIVAFYTKGRAPHLLAGFYETRAQVEIDDYQSYDKALDALSDAVKCLAKVKSSDGQQEAKLAELQRKITLIKKFSHARRLKTNGENCDEALTICENLLEEPELDAAVRVGDVIGFVIDHHCQQGNFKAAFTKMKELLNMIPSQNIKYYVKQASLDALQKHMGFTMNSGDHKHNDKEEDEVEEDLNIP
ncbi:intraflagellar transport protein 140 homolog isoform X1 [Stigmatopora argus]